MILRQIRFLRSIRLPTQQFNGVQLIFRSRGQKIFMVWIIGAVRMLSRIAFLLCTEPVELPVRANAGVIIMN